MHGLLKMLVLSSLCIAVTGMAGECRYTSPAHRVPLLELYTSEGCSSCPPADRWMSGLAGIGLDQQQVVPLSLHVDYWNYIGWQDPYSSAQYTQRQRQVAQNNRLNTIYTPQLVLQGRDFRSWRHMNIKSIVAEINRQPAQASIELAVMPGEAGQLGVEVKAVSQVPGSRLVVAVYENNLTSQVTSGENSGRKLDHDYVVRQLVTVTSASDTMSLNRMLQIKQEWNRANLGIAAFVEDGRGDILQAFAHNIDCTS